MERFHSVDGALARRSNGIKELKARCGQQEARIEALEKEVKDLKETKEQILVLQTQVGFCTGFGIQH
jgi:archaellum component FlaC